MDSKQHIINVVTTERARGLDASEAESLRWSVWLVWEDRGGGPETMSSSEWADAVAALGIKRGTAMNRYSEARRNWEVMNG